MRQPSEIEINGKKLDAILEEHRSWIDDSDTGTRADLRGADLRCAYLRGADLRGAYLSSADLRCADLNGADLRGAYLSSADLSGADLRGAYLSSADLRCADLSSADLRCADLSSAYLSSASYKDVKIQKTRIFSGLYKYQVIAIVAEDGSQYIAMGCKFQTRQQWADNFWNNTAEFPDDGSEKTALRKFALRVACEWLDMQKAE